MNEKTTRKLCDPSRYATYGEWFAAVEAVMLKERREDQHER